MIHRVISTLRRTARIAAERPRATLWTSLALTSALFAVGVAAVAADNVDRWAGSRPSGHGASMVVYLGEGVDAARATTLVAELRGLAGVEHAELVPASESARRLQAALGSDVALLDGVDLASLPASVEIALSPGVRDVVGLSPTVRALRNAPGVADVVVEDTTDRIAGALGSVRVVAWTGAALFGGLALIVVLAALRVKLDRSKQELAVTQLLGASPSFIVIPTALAGALQGAVAATLAVLALCAGLHIYSGAIAHAISSALGPVDLAFPPAAALAAFIAIGGGLGLVGGGLAGAARVAREA